MKRALTLGMIACVLISVHVAADDGDVTSMVELHKKVTEGLLDLRKQYPAEQPKVYAMLDQVNKLFSGAKSALQKGVATKKILQDKIAENTALKNELTALKTDATTTKKTLDVVHSDLIKQLEDERVHVEQLTKERKELLSKVAGLEDEQKDYQEKKKSMVSASSFETEAVDKLLSVKR